ncbi:MAG: helix-turn-helix domain-containing protein [Desulfomonile sp.]|nr:helix-turn-helix domain-containing protein [Desulfomonile sp.]
MSEKELLTADETAEKLRIAKRTLLRWVRENKIESVRISEKRILFTEEAIERFIQTRTNGTESATIKRDRNSRRPVQPKTKEGGGKRSLGEMWRGLRKEVHTWA